MESIEKNLEVSEQMIINFMEANDLTSAKNFCSEILEGFSDCDTAIFFDAYIKALECPEYYEFFFKKYEETFALIEKKDLENEEKVEKIKRYMTFTNSLIKSIAETQISPSEERIFEFIYRHIDMIIVQKQILGEDLRNYLCKEIMMALKRMLDPICRMHAADLDNVIRCCYIYGDVEKKTKAIINDREHITEKEIEEEIGGEILKLQEEIDKIKPEYSKIMESGNFFVKILPKTKELARKTMDLVAKQHGLVEKYMEEVRVPYYFRLEELWQYHEEEIDEVLNKDEIELKEKVESFSEKYKVENYFYHYFLVKYEKIKLVNRKKYKKYDSSKKGNFFEA